MRNVFDQYTQNENRLTHALASVLHADGGLRARFLKQFLPSAGAPSASRVTVDEQSLPGQPMLTENEAEERGVPDMWLFDDDGGWCAVVESKITAPLYAGQVQRHIQVALRRGFHPVIPVTISVNPPKNRLPAHTVELRWKDIYRWLESEAAPGSLAEQASKFFERLEAEMARNEQLQDGTLTTFTGFHFANPENYSYLEAKRVLRLALSELRKDRDLRREVGMDPDLEGRQSLTGRHEDFVWDFLQVKAAHGAKSHTSNIHLTLGVHRRFVDCLVTIPHGLVRTARKRLVEVGEEGFQDLLGQVLERMSQVLRIEPLAVPTLRVIQRRYPSQRAKPFVDALLEVDLRTVVERRPRLRKQPKKQTEWLQAAFGSFSNKNSNIQMQVGVVFPFERCPTLETPRSITLISAAWCACRPLLDRAYGRK
jgi:hypothetical protein